MVNTEKSSWSRVIRSTIQPGIRSPNLESLGFLRLAI